MANTETKNIQIVRNIYRRIHPLKYFTTTSLSLLWDILKSYVLKFGSILIVVNLLFLSLISFFHFLLDHSIQIIESWLNLHKWEILILAKFISITLIKLWKTSELRISKDFFLFEETFQSKFSFSFFVVNVFVCVYFIFLFNLDLGNFSQSFNLHNLSARKLAFAVVFYLIDLFYITYFIQEGPKNIFKLFQVIVLSLFFFSISSLLIPYKSEFISLSYFIMLNALNIYYFFGKIFLFPVFFVFINVALNMLFFGGELIGLKQTNIILDKNFIFTSLIIMHSIIFIYILIKELKISKDDLQLESD